MISDYIANKQFNCWKLETNVVGGREFIFKWNYYKPYEIFLRKKFIQ